MKEIRVERQNGDYCVVEATPSIETGGCAYAVRMAGAESPLSFHKNVTDAVRKILIYQAGDKRRRS